MTNKAKQTADGRRTEEAAGWVARLQSRDATDADRREFRAWLAGNPANAVAYEELQSLWGDLRAVPIEKDRLKKLRLSRRAVTGNVVAVGLIAVLATTLYQLGFVDRLRADHYTTVGEVGHFTLEDGTRVDLNTDSAIRVVYSSAERRIELLRGEAFFDVAKNPARPFVVVDDVLRATALGTRYGVRDQGTGSDVQVEEGRVEVASSRSQVALGAGDVARVDRYGALDVSTADVASRLAWREGKLVFSGQPLREVLATLERYRHGRIVVLDEAAADHKVSGIFDLTDTDEALALLQAGLPVTITHLTGMMVVVRSR
ncbi:transmembrane sensor [Angulomicrobium tetraedrale]|uniref:Transmembrane sensor n=1 Tax=Ancylobacter tetraedralis TaxID=217068 RepID=A0A839ZGY4_9HYPH|nr:FecR family protein [Ancylobacter tetraedralis]MBB3773928.1 transmembrane sensor [Ancylobacter tetraedralis]